ncbi:MAG TPA: DUF177 domain-containing protein [Desulfohalobiaceae bacterium]|nr:DUF177 domain-containing protein [Desulfohalobiaceae bacterium]
MFELWLELTNIPSEGVYYTINDQRIWQQPINDFELPYKIIGSVLADVHIQPQSEGYLIQGSINGEIVLPCSRCAEPTNLELNDNFKIFESVISPLNEDNISESAEVTYLRKLSGIFELDIAGILWEQFILTIPMKPICSEECLGLCPHCGHNLNYETCQCPDLQEDLQMAVFKNIKLKQ